jgi:PadR family transcriptional regulator
VSDTVGKDSALLPGTLDLLILKAVSLKPHHGLGVLQRIEQITGQRLSIEQGALYPALHRLEHQGLVDFEWGTSENNRRAKYYRLTTKGKRRLSQHVERWNQLVAAMAAAINARTGEG